MPSFKRSPKLILSVWLIWLLTDANRQSPIMKFKQVMMYSYLLLSLVAFDCLQLIKQKAHTKFIHLYEL